MAFLEILESIRQTVQSYLSENNIGITNFTVEPSKPGFGDITCNIAFLLSKELHKSPQDISKEIWKRLYHNAPYLLKTKGTERGIKALMSCYGVPETILNNLGSGYDSFGQNYFKYPFYRTGGELVIE